MAIATFLVVPIALDWIVHVDVTHVIRDLRSHERGGAFSSKSTSARYLEDTLN
jgi:hypothetical protein